MIEGVPAIVKGTRKITEGYPVIIDGRCATAQGLRKIVREKEKWIACVPFCDCGSLSSVGGGGKIKTETQFAPRHSSVLLRHTYWAQALATSLPSAYHLH